MDNETVVSVEPVAMLLFCPRCHLQHIDEPDERTPDWTNPPHKSHLCHGCGCIWRPADVPTNGVASIKTLGKSDNWTAARPSQPPVTDVGRLKIAFAASLMNANAGMRWLDHDSMDEMIEAAWVGFEEPSIAAMQAPSGSAGE